MYSNITIKWLIYFVVCQLNADICPKLLQLCHSKSAPESPRLPYSSSAPNCSPSIATFAKSIVSELPKGVLRIIL